MVESEELHRGMAAHGPGEGTSPGSAGEEEPGTPPPEPPEPRSGGGASTEPAMQGGGPAGPGGKRRWYVIRVQTGREEQVKTAIEKLKQARNLHDKIGDILIPAEKRMEYSGGRRKVRAHKLFPGYVIISMALSNETWFAIRETPGVGDFLGLKDPKPLQDEEVERLLQSIRETEERPKVQVNFQKGDLVRVKDGPFENFEGTVQEINERKGRVNVSLVIFGRATEVDLGYWQLEKA